MLRRQFQKVVVAWIVVAAEPLLFEAVIVCGSLLQLLGHFHPSDEHRTITASNAMLYSCRAHGCGHQEDRVSVRYRDRDTFGARRPPSSRALPSDPVSHEKNPECREAADVVALSLLEHARKSQRQTQPARQMKASGCSPSASEASCSEFQSNALATCRVRKRWSPTASVGQELYPRRVAWLGRGTWGRFSSSVPSVTSASSVFPPGAVGSKCSLERPLHNGRALCAKYFVF
jgi:hypothetical protein